MGSMARFEALLRERIAAAVQAVTVPGYVAGVYHQGRQVEVAHGIANLNTGAEMTTDTRWLLGSITKVMVATLLLRHVEWDEVGLDDPVVRHLPGFRLAEAGAAERITIRQLLNHGNGIDADSLMPAGDAGAGAVESYVDALGRCGTLFAPGTRLHYSNPGFSLAARIIEAYAGRPFNAVLESELFAAIGMSRSCTSPAQAILHRTAIGAFSDPRGGPPRATGMFMLPASGAGAGSTPIVTVGDLIMFGRMHLDGGIAPNGHRLLSAGLAGAMRTPSFDPGRPDVPPIGLGWWVAPIAGTTALWHGGGSPGGLSSLAVFPELDLVVAGFGSGAAALVHDAVVAVALEELGGRSVGLHFEVDGRPSDIGAHAGRYEAFQMRIDVEAAGETLKLTSDFVPIDADHAAMAAGFMGEGAFPSVQELVPVGAGLFAPKGIPHSVFGGLCGRTALVSFDGDPGDGRPGFVTQRLLSARRVSG